MNMKKSKMTPKMKARIRATTKIISAGFYYKNDEPNGIYLCFDESDWLPVQEHFAAKLNADLQTYQRDGRAFVDKMLNYLNDVRATPPYERTQDQLLHTAGAIGFLAEIGVLDGEYNGAGYTRRVLASALM